MSSKKQKQTADKHLLNKINKGKNLMSFVTLKIGVGIIK